METIIIITLTLLGFGIYALLVAYIIGNFNNKTFWLNIYRSDDGFLFSDRLLCDTKREAIFDAGGRKDYVKTIKIKL